MEEALERAQSSTTTSITVTQRLSTVRKADMIYVVDNGQVVERGNHEDLMKNRDGFYYKLWNLQL